MEIVAWHQYELDLLPKASICTVNLPKATWCMTEKATYGATIEGKILQTLMDPIPTGRSSISLCRNH